MRSGLKPPPALIQALALIKRCAAEVNRHLNLLAPNLAEAITQASDEVTAGRLDDQFVVDLYQTGSERPPT